MMNDSERLFNKLVRVDSAEQSMSDSELKLDNSNEVSHIIAILREQLEHGGLCGLLECDGDFPVFDSGLYFKPVDKCGLA